ncbi:hypothetical protein K505DRAFT_340848 [Melanomma pulvis-pyrius CBS 109.77]|uniref:Uncharacterized protein n=1 Tax=Melanomma pulvis-pyrius CBS 109.77 TaxID=1314802 RepID=A0A6A6X0T2_9PLEO|nr:hypothetical protein K505DRAFT_340848 [Melanomma pulvis-pyrius CBS 109.77]
MHVPHMHQDASHMSWREATRPCLQNPVRRNQRPVPTVDGPRPRPRSSSASQVRSNCRRLLSMPGFTCQSASLVRASGRFHGLLCVLALSRKSRLAIPRDAIKFQVADHAAFLDGWQGQASIRGLPTRPYAGAICRSNPRYAMPAGGRGPGFLEACSRHPPSTPCLDGNGTSVRDAELWGGTFTRVPVSVWWINPVDERRVNNWSINL